MNPYNLSFAAGDQVMYLNPQFSDDKLVPVPIEPILQLSLHGFPDYYFITAVVLDDETNKSAFRRYRLSHDHYEELDKFLTHHGYRHFARHDPNRPGNVGSLVVQYFKPVPMKILHWDNIYMKINGTFMFVNRIYNMSDVDKIRRLTSSPRLKLGDSL